MDLKQLSALELGAKIKEKVISVEEAVKYTLSTLKENKESYNSYITLLEEEVILQRAKEVQEGIESGKYSDSPLAGVPVAVKDNICTKDILTTCGSHMLSDFVPPYNATVVDRLLQEGAVIIGKTNMDEFGMGSTTETSYFGVTKNPRNTEHTPGGSSGGSAAAVAASECFYALGSDTGGSIRQPSSYCGVTGIKPTYGTVSRFGLVAFASSLDQIGPIGKNVSDCAAILDLIKGHDKMDSTSVDKEYDSYLSHVSSDIKGMRVGIPKGYLGEGLQEEIKEKIYEATKILEAQGAIVEEFDLESVEYAIPAYYVIACAEASSNLSRYDGVKYGYRGEDQDGLSTLYKTSRSQGFSHEVKRRMMLGSFVLSSGYYDAYYNKAQKVRRRISQGFDKAFEQYDVILGPTAPTTAPRLGESLSDPLKMYLGDIYTVAVNLAGLPAISIPCGADKSGLPIGLQFIGKQFGEKDIIKAGYALEQGGK